MKGSASPGPTSSPAPPVERRDEQPDVAVDGPPLGTVALVAGIVANALELLATGIVAAAIVSDASHWPHWADFAGLAGLLIILVALVAGREALRVDPESKPGFVGVLLGAGALGYNLYAFPALFVGFLLKGLNAPW